MTLSDRFMARVAPVRGDGCWEWPGARSDTGYGTIGAGGPGHRTLLAHRVSYELFVGPIPEGFEIDHLCRTPACVNPDHLEVVTHRENVLRSDAVSAVQARQTHCKRGHLLPDKRNSRGQRICRSCDNARQRRRSRARKLGQAW